MRLFKCGLVALLLVLEVSYEAYGQSTSSPETFQLKAKYYECINPAVQPPCVCAQEEQKAKSCPGCQGWAEKTVSSEFSISAEQWRSFYSTGTLPANLFVQNIAEEIYQVGVSAPTTVKLYQDPGRYGWLELEKGGEAAGSVAVWSGGAGLVIEDKDGIPQILYPSRKLQGALNVEAIDKLASPEDVKYIIPREYLSAMAADAETGSSPPERN